MNLLVFNCSPVRDGATAEIVKIVSEKLSGEFKTKCICIDDYDFGFCKGCRACHKTARCVLSDDIPLIMSELEWADIIVCVSPSYWADVPGQFKAFIDRCTPWCDTHDPHAAISDGKMGYAIVLRTGPNMAECERLIQTIEHFYGHLEIECCGSLALCSVDGKDKVGGRKEEIAEFCEKLLKNSQKI